MLTASADGTVRTWDAKPPELVALMPTAASAPVSVDERDRVRTRWGARSGGERFRSRTLGQPRVDAADVPQRRRGFGVESHSAPTGTRSSPVPPTDQCSCFPSRTRPSPRRRCCRRPRPAFRIAHVRVQSERRAEIATAGLDGTVHLIDLATNTTRRVLITPSKQRFYDAQFSADGKQLVTADTGGSRASGTSRRASKSANSTSPTSFRSAPRRSVPTGAGSSPRASTGSHAGLGRRNAADSTAMKK